MKAEFEKQITEKDNKIKNLCKDIIKNFVVRS